jgi:hypothetical protein
MFKLTYHPLSAVRGWRFNIFAATLHIWRSFVHPQAEDAPCRGDRDPLVMECTTNRDLNLKIKVSVVTLLRRMEVTHVSNDHSASIFRFKAIKDISFFVEC